MRWVGDFFYGVDSRVRYEDTSLIFTQISTLNITAATAILQHQRFSCLNNTLVVAGKVANLSPAH